VFCREDIEEPADLRDVALQAVKALDLHFGAVDIIWNKKDNKCYVLEVNTAPGVEGTSTEIYADSIKAYLQKQQNAKSVTVDFLI
jgi:D-alanine-D-alanine ligase-like ATP-grasp enzyme